MMMDVDDDFGVKMTAVLNEAYVNQERIAKMAARFMIYYR